MCLRPIVAGLIAASVFARGAPAQVTVNDAASPVGVWRGVSVCLVRPSPCNDETVVYRVTRANASDSIAIDARKIVNGKEEEMGILGCLFGPRDGSLTCAMRNGVWHFAIRGDNLVGELRLPDSTKFRDVRTVRSR